MRSCPTFIYKGMIPKLAITGIIDITSFLVPVKILENSSIKNVKRNLIFVLFEDDCIQRYEK